MGPSRPRVLHQLTGCGAFGRPARSDQQPTAILGGGIVRLRRLLIGEAERFPELASEYYARAPGRVMGALLDRALFTSAADAPAREHVTARARAGADAFLRAYRP